MLEFLFNKVINKETPRQVFSWEVWEVFKNTYFEKTSANDCFLNQCDTKRTFIFHDFNCKGKLLIDLMEYKVCRIQYIGKPETQFNIYVFLFSIQNFTHRNFEALHFFENEYESNFTIVSKSNFYVTVEFSVKEFGYIILIRFIPFNNFVQWLGFLLRQWKF